MRKETNEGILISQYVYSTGHKVIPLIYSTSNIVKYKSIRFFVIENDNEMSLNSSL